MTASTLDTEPITTNGDDDLDEMHHYWCCDPDVAYCGTDLSSDVTVTDVSPSDLCVVCKDILDRSEPDQCVYTCNGGSNA